MAYIRQCNTNFVLIFYLLVFFRIEHILKNVMIQKKFSVTTLMKHDVIRKFYLIITMVIFKCYFSGELIALT